MIAHAVYAQRGPQENQNQRKPNPFAVRSLPIGFAILDSDGRIPADKHSGYVFCGSGGNVMERSFRRKLARGTDLLQV